jgi:hypothetical protein
MIISEFCDAAITPSQDLRYSRMTDCRDNNNQSLFDKLIAVLLRLPWADILGLGTASVSLSAQVQTRLPDLCAQAWQGHRGPKSSQSEPDALELAGDGCRLKCPNLRTTWERE